MTYVGYFAYQRYIYFLHIYNNNQKYISLNISLFFLHNYYSEIA